MTLFVEIIHKRCVFFNSGPFLVVMLINSVMIVICLKIAFFSGNNFNFRIGRRQLAKDKRFISFICLFCILGMTWLSFLLYIHKVYNFFSYLFIFLNGTQVGLQGCNETFAIRVQPKPTYVYV